MLISVPSGPLVGARLAEPEDHVDAGQRPAWGREAGGGFSSFGFSASAPSGLGSSSRSLPVFPLGANGPSSSGVAGAGGGGGGSGGADCAFAGAFLWRGFCASAETVRLPTKARDSALTSHIFVFMWTSRNREKRGEPRRLRRGATLSRVRGFGRTDRELGPGQLWQQQRPPVNMRGIGG